MSLGDQASQILLGEPVARAVENGLWIGAAGYEPRHDALQLEALADTTRASQDV
jgi:hypothetical protein